MSRRSTSAVSRLAAAVSEAWADARYADRRRFEIVLKPADRRS